MEYKLTSSFKSFEKSIKKSYLLLKEIVLLSHSLMYTRLMYLNGNFVHILSFLPVLLYYFTPHHIQIGVII